MDWSAEQGYFYENPGADRDAAPTSSMWKNRDFLRLKDEALFLLDPRPGITVLELGCANGSGLVYCGLQGSTVYGQDLDAGAVAMANEKLRQLGIKGEAKLGDARHLLFDNASVDAVLSSDFHEHLDDETQVAVLREAWRVLRPGGLLVLKTPNLAYLRTSLWFKRFQALVRGRDPRGFVIPHSRGTSDPQHIGLTVRTRVTAELEQAGFHHYRFHYAPLRRFGRRPVIDVLSTAIPGVRDLLSEDLIVAARKPIAAAHFPD